MINSPLFTWNSNDPSLVHTPQIREVFSDVKMEICISRKTSKINCYKNAIQFTKQPQENLKLFVPQHNSKTELCHQLL